MSPKRTENRLIALDACHAEQILEPFGFVERVALHVEIEIAWPRLRQPRESALRLGRQQLVDLLACQALVQLQSGLVTQPLEGRTSDPNRAVPGFRRGELSG